MKFLEALAAATGVALLSVPALATDKFAVKAGTIVTMTGETIENGVIVIDGARISAVGSQDDVKIPWDAEVLDVPELTAFPGFVEAHSDSGMDRSNESIDVAPFLDVRDSIDPVNFYFEDCKRAGITTINVQQGNNCVVGGVGMIVKPHGMLVEELLVVPRAGVKISAAPKSGKSRATQAMALRQAFAELRRYLEEVVQEKRDGNDRARREALAQGRDLEGERGKGRAMQSSGWTVEGLELVPRGELDEKQEPLLDVVEGNLPVYFYCAQPMDVKLAIEVATTNGFLGSTTLVLGSADCWKASDLIAKAGCPVILPTDLEHEETDPVTEEETTTFLPKHFAEKGITFALTSANASTQSLWFQAAMCVGGGVSRADALAAVTTTPAKMLGLEERVGALKPGLDGNVLLFSGDPLSVTAFVEYVVLDGKLVYDRSKDVRVKHLLEGVASPGTEATEEVADDEGDGQ
jgi:imidazolonepropionase-like amidohydrolase